MSVRQKSQLLEDLVNSGVVVVVVVFALNRFVEILFRKEHSLPWKSYDRHRTYENWFANHSGRWRFCFFVWSLVFDVFVVPPCSSSCVLLLLCFVCFLFCLTFLLLPLWSLFLLSFCSCSCSCSLFFIWFDFVFASSCLLLLLLLCCSCWSCPTLFFFIFGHCFCLTLLFLLFFLFWFFLY